VSVNLQFVCGYDLQLQSLAPWPRTRESAVLTAAALTALAPTRMAASAETATAPQVTVNIHMLIYLLLVHLKYEDV